MMNYKDNILTGTIIGILIPAICILLVYAIMFPGFKFFDFFRFTQSKHVLENIVSLCGIPNLVAFYFFIRGELYENGKGIILATFILVLIVIILKFFI